MDSKTQEADRVRMEQAVAGHAQDARHAIEAAQGIAMYDERLWAWNRAMAAVQLARQEMVGYMEKYGLVGEVGE